MILSTRVIPCFSQGRFDAAAAENARLEGLTSEQRRVERLYKRVLELVREWGAFKADLSNKRVEPLTQIERLKRFLCATWNVVFGCCYSWPTADHQKGCEGLEADIREGLQSLDRQVLDAYLDRYVPLAPLWEEEWKTTRALFQETFKP
jgi:hypothetical protein